MHEYKNVIKLKVDHVNIPIFLPELACPHRCIFCNQSQISGKTSIPSIHETVGIIEKYLLTIKKDTGVQVAFFGGSFTGLPMEMQEAYLRVVQPYIESGKITGIRLSTRPDYISDPILDMLLKYGVEEIELGAQSFNDEVLKSSGRGHTAADIVIASEKILTRGIRLGLQMMTGLPGDTDDMAFQTAKQIVAAGAHSTRIYPTLVIKDTPLEALYNRGVYKPQTMSEAVGSAARLYRFFEDNNLTVLRVGLHSNEDFNNGVSLIDGPYHPSFKELVLSKIWMDIFDNLLPKEKGKLQIFVATEQVNFAIGYKAENRTVLREKYGWIQIIQDPSLGAYECKYSYC